MHSGRRFTFTEVIIWARRDTYNFILISLIPTSLYYFLNVKWLVIPWVAIALVGTAAAFVFGFKNTQTYNRLWEARQIWGGIVNSSRACQGKSERIKNFPYPRQFATINQMVIRLFGLMLPFGILQEFGKLTKDLGEGFIWVTVPCSVIVGWVFYIMERIGESTENSFEGGPNDVPISNISRNIEIDLRDMLDEKYFPATTTAVNYILM